MSFFDDASLVFLPSGEAGKDGKAYSMKPVPEYGNELVTNGGFDTDSDWNFTNAGGSNGWRIANGRAICDSVNPSSGRNLNSSTSLVSGKSYKVTLDILQSADELEILIGSTLIQNAFPIGTTIGASYIIDSSQHSGGTFSLFGGSSDLQEIDNVSVKEVIVDGDFTFSRGSNLTATRVDSNGLIEKGRENLLLQSNNFDTLPFIPTIGTATSGQNGYDGSNDAWLFESNDTSPSYIRQAINSDNPQTISIYAKAGTANYVVIYNISASLPRAYFNLSDGTIGVTTNEIDSNIESVGNGWYRCSLTYNQPITQVRIYVAENDGVLGSSVGANIYIQDAQLEAGLVATEYIESGATTGKAGILEDSPRFDYSGGASCASLLLEPSRTNLIGYSEYLEGTGWTAQAGITLTPNTTETLSPEGLNNAYKVVSTDATKGFYISGLNVTNDAVRTIYLKGSVGGETIVFKDPSGFGTPSTKTLTTDWQRFEMATTNDGNTYQGLFIDDISVGTIYAYGAQVELGSYPTSYIPNHSGGSETRNADVCEGAGTSSTFNDSEGVLYVELSYLQDGRLAIKNSDSSDQIVIGTSSGNVFYRVKENNNNIITEFTGVSGTLNRKIALRYKSRDTSIFIDGVEYNVNTSNYTLSGLNEFLFVSEGGSNTTYGNVKQVLVFGTALSDSECITLTS